MSTSGRGPGARLPRPWRARAAAVLAVMAGGLLATACSSGPSSTGSGGASNAGGSANSPSLVSYARCMRSHGVPNFPGPGSNGQIPGGKSTLVNLAASNSHFQAAQQTCGHLWPYQAPTQAQDQQQLTGDLKFARCMRSRGLPNFPDPTSGPDGPVFVFSVSKDGFDPRSPQILAKAHECLHVLPPGSPLPHASVGP